MRPFCAEHNATHITHDNVVYDTLVGDAHVLHACTRAVSAFGLLFEPLLMYLSQYGRDRPAAQKKKNKTECRIPPYFGRRNTVASLRRRLRWRRRSATFLSHCLLCLRIRMCVTFYKLCAVVRALLFFRFR